MDGDDAVGETLKAARIERARNKLCENGEAFLCPGIAGIGFAKNREMRLRDAVKAGRDMDERLMLQKLLFVEIGKQGVFAQLDIVAPRRCFGGHIGRDVDARRRLAEIFRQSGVKPRFQHRRREFRRWLKPVCGRIEFTQQRIETSCEIERRCLAVSDG